jgi:hypothetical protein
MVWLIHLIRRHWSEIKVPLDLPRQVSFIYLWELTAFRVSPQLRRWAALGISPPQTGSFEAGVFPFGRAAESLEGVRIHPGAKLH